MAPEKGNPKTVSLSCQTVKRVLTAVKWLGRVLPVLISVVGSSNAAKIALLVIFALLEPCRYVVLRFFARK